MFKKNKGSLTFEASLSLVLFIFTFLTILYLCKFAKAQVILQHAINQTAMEISKYSYISNKLGLRNDKTVGNKTINDTDKLISEIISLTDVVSEEINKVGSLDLGYDDSNADDYYNVLAAYKKYDEAKKIIIYSYESISEAAISTKGSAQGYFKNPKSLLKGFAAIAKDEIADFVISKYVAAPMCEALIQKYLSVGGHTADEYLKRLGVNDGLEGLNFKTSTIFKNGSNIDITLIYTMSADFPLLPRRDLCFKLNAATVGWESDLFYDEVDIDTESDKSYINIWDYGGKRTTDEFIKMLSEQRNLSIVRTPMSLDFYDGAAGTCTYVHSMNTEMKSYIGDSGLNLSQIKSKIKFYANDALNDAKRTSKVIMEDGEEFSIKKPEKNKVKVIMVIQESSLGSSDELNSIIAEIKKELNADNIEIELFYSDGIIEG